MQKFPFLEIFKFARSSKLIKLVLQPIWSEMFRKTFDEISAYQNYHFCRPDDFIFLSFNMELWFVNDYQKFDGSFIIDHISVFFPVKSRLIFICTYKWGKKVQRGNFPSKIFGEWFFQALFKKCFPDFLEVFNLIFSKFRI